jgi:hypothetical protein
MLKRIINFLLFSTGITPADHKEPDKFAEIRARREAWEREQRAREDAERAAEADASDGGPGDAGGGDGGGGGGGL